MWNLSHPAEQGLYNSIEAKKQDINKLAEKCSLANLQGEPKKHGDTL